ncbi:hypothetical protein SADUNF_Sadunf15G0054800 [Salix dunnii]|uniref:Uncharacterized protein n=1 Tax=Salix dunnii TaxID=1413687 RepID=A0A835JG48_9ROSI|nr:hypothetical protein SADUNF_Sadunf15G0054800 [Salix dunnii]
MSAKDGAETTASGMMPLHRTDKEDMSFGLEGHKDGPEFKYSIPLAGSGRDRGFYIEECYLCFVFHFLAPTIRTTLSESKEIRVCVDRSLALLSVGVLIQGCRDIRKGRGFASSGRLLPRFGLLRGLREVKHNSIYPLLQTKNILLPHSLLFLSGCPSLQGNYSFVYR